MRWNQWTLVFAVALAGTGVVLVARPGENGAGTPKKRLVSESQPHLAVPLDKNDEMAKKLKAWREERLAAARTAEASSLAQYTAGRILQLQLYSYSRQLLDAELAVAKTKAERLQGYRDHRDRMKKVMELDQTRFKLGRVSIEDVSSARSYYLEAEIWLAEGGMPASRKASP